MNNLGAYKDIVTFSKKVGGPYQLIALVALGGYAAIRAGEVGVRQVIKSTKEKNKQKRSDSSTLYIVHTGSESNDGLIFKQGDTYRVLEVDHDAVLIEKTGVMDNPYCVSAKFLSSISNFKIC